MEKNFIAVCKCGHARDLHHHDHSCTGIEDLGRLKFCKCDEFRASNLTQQEGELVAKKQKQGRKLVLFEATSKNADELLDKKNMTNAAIFYRVIAASEKPLTRIAIYKASESKCESGAAWERLGHQTHDTLARLKKAGFVKRIETREEAAPRAAKANGAAKPKRVRKPRRTDTPASSPAHARSEQSAGADAAA
jgi:hypothetical protein